MRRIYVLRIAMPFAIGAGFAIATWTWWWLVFGVGAAIGFGVAGLRKRRA